MVRCRIERSMLGLWLIVVTMTGCGSTVTRDTTSALVEWDKLGSMAVAVQKSVGTAWYLLEGNAATEVAKGLRENTVAESSPSRTTQRFGKTEFHVLAFERHGGRLHRFLVDFQYVEGMGGKRDPNPSSTFLPGGQGKRCLSVLTAIEESGRALTKTQFDRYSSQFAHTGYVFLYWMN